MVRGAEAAGGEAALQGSGGAGAGDRRRHQVVRPRLLPADLPAVAVVDDLCLQ